MSDAVVSDRSLRWIKYAVLQARRARIRLPASRFGEQANAWASERGYEDENYVENALVSLQSLWCTQWRLVGGLDLARLWA